MHASMAERHVQAIISEATYQALWGLAKQEKRPIKDVVREAIEAYLRRAQPRDQDPLLGIVGTGTLRENNWSERKDWRE